jgi:formylmethanofuran dehydrogenase subunit E
MDTRNANFEHYFPVCNNCKELFTPDNIDLETMLCAGCYYINKQKIE